MRSLSRWITAVGSVTLVAASPLSGGTLIEIFNHDFNAGTFVGWSDKVPAECDDGIQNGLESDVDCGGLDCDACQPGDSCFIDDDCASLPAWTQAYPSCSSGTCTMGCMGENYDPNNNIADGCEVLDSPQGNHSTGASVNLGSFNCVDTPIPFMGAIPSDSRLHAFPPVGGFNTATGSTPDYFFLNATGGITCQNDLSMTLTVSGSTNPTCYRLMVFTDNGTYSCTTNGAATCLVSSGPGSYPDNSIIYFKVDKTCNLPVQESVAYNVNGHI